MGCFFDEIWCRYCKIDKNELNEIDRKERKTMPMNRELHPRTTSTTPTTSYLGRRKIKH